MRLRNGWLLIGVLAFGFLFSACGTNQKEGAAKVVRIGTKNFTEQLILGELMAQLIENRTPLVVERTFNLGGTMICHQALIKGEIDLYAEYTGTALTTILKQEKRIADPDSAYKVVAAAYEKDFACQWLAPFGFNNTFTITVRRGAAQAKGWRTISDLKNAAAELQAGFTAEFAERPDGYPGLEKAYGFAFGKVSDLDPGLMYQAIADERVDVICAFATDGRIPAYELLPLKDDRQFFPPYYAAPVVRQAVLQRHPALRQALAPLAGALADTTMQRLNFEVDEKGREPAQIARTFLLSQGLLIQ